MGLKLPGHISSPVEHNTGGGFQCPKVYHDNILVFLGLIAFTKMCIDVNLCHINFNASKLVIVPSFISVKRSEVNFAPKASDKAFLVSDVCSFILVPN